MMILMMLLGGWRVWDLNDYDDDGIISSKNKKAAARAHKNSIWAPTKKFTKNGLCVIYCFGLMHDY